MTRGRGAGTNPVLITEAAPSMADEHAARKRRYVLTMALRAVCLILATVFYQTPIVMGVFAVLAIVLPWVAVMVANDRPPKKSLNAHRFRGHHDESQLETPTPRAAIAPTRVIDAEE